MHSESLSGPILRDNYELVLLHVGIEIDSLFDLEYYIYGHVLPQVWIQSLWEFYYQCKIKLLR